MSAATQPARNSSNWQSVKPLLSAQPVRRTSTRPKLRESAEIREQKRILEYKKTLAQNVLSPLRQSKNPVVLALSDRIERCNSNQNLFVASDLHNSDGECFTGKGSLWMCRSKLCPNCIGKQARENRKALRLVMNAEKLRVDENWYFITFTMPNLDLAEMNLTDVAALMQTAWQRFTHSEARGRAKTWFQKTIRGGAKSCEFTFTENSVYHYHIHSICISKMSIQRNNFNAIREAWTKALEFAFSHHKIKLTLKTSDNLAVVNMKKIDNKESATKELCKYITKSDSWGKLPLAELEKLATIPRFGRMFEFFGVCRETARELRKKPLETFANDDSAKGSKASQNTYLDTKELIRRFADERRQKRRQSWRKRCLEISRDALKLELLEEIEETQNIRRHQLRLKYPLAEFQTLDGRTF